MAVYALIGGFGVEEWREFAREKLKLHDKTIFDVEEKYSSQFKEQRIQMLRQWQKIGEENNESLFAKLKHEFFCGSYRPLVTQPIPSCDDVVDGPMLYNSPKFGDIEKYSHKGNGGCALIICNSFNSGRTCSQRKAAAEEDAKKMESLWKDTLECKLVQDKAHMDVSAKDMRGLCEELASQDKFDFTVLVISTHGGGVPKAWLDKYGPDCADTLGTLEQKEWNQLTKESEEEVIIGDDERIIRLADLKDLFGNEKAKCLVHKPKLFILQHCRGNLVASGVFKGVTEAADCSAGFESKQPETSSYSCPDLLPLMSDVVVGYPTQASYKAYRDDNGSWYITLVAKVFNHYWEGHHVVDMLTMVNGRMKGRNPGVVKDSYVKPMSVLESSLVKAFYLERPQ